MTIQVKKKDIGRMLYPIDNSYSQDLRTGQYPTVNNGAALAGRQGLAPVKVKILSEPMKLTLIGATGKPTVVEMVMVEYQGNKFIVLNYFEKQYDLIDLRNEYIGHF